MKNKKIVTYGIIVLMIIVGIFYFTRQFQPSIQTDLQLMQFTQPTTTPFVKGPTEPMPGSMQVKNKE